MSAIKAKKVLKYTLLPGVIPRLKELFGSGFGYLAFLMAQIYSLVRLLPNSHPYLNPQNIGRFGLRHVIAEAANHLVVNRKNIDQIIIFFALAAGLVIFALQFVFLAYTMLIAPALAQATPDLPQGLSIFVTSNPDYDIAFIMLDRVFGIKDLFGSCVSQGISCTPPDAALIAQGVQPDVNRVITDPIPWPIHDALHAMLSFYSYGLLFIGLFIFLYFIVVVITETAVTGTPFGQRFQNVWVPIRLVMAIGLLVPIQSGLNSAQYIVLNAAKFGSSFATNGWITFNYAMNKSAREYAGGSSATDAANKNIETPLVGYPATPDLSSIYQAMSIIHTCAYTEWAKNNEDKFVNLKDRNRVSVSDQDARLLGIDKAHMDDSFMKVKPYFAKNTIFGENKDLRMEWKHNTDIEDALEFYNGGNIRIVFGEHKPDFAATGNIDPICGEMRIPVTSIPDPSANGVPAGPDRVLEIYYNMVQDLWFGKDHNTPAQNPLFQFAARHTGIYYIKGADGASVSCSIGCSDTNLPSCTGGSSPECITKAADFSWGEKQIHDRRLDMVKNLEQNYNNYLAELAGSSGIKQEILDRGWGGAGMWYNHVAELNGAYVVATQAIPEIRRFPKTMEEIRKLKRAIDEAVTPNEQFDPVFTSNPDLEKKKIDEEQADTLHKAFSFWDPDNAAEKLSGNIFEDTIAFMFGLDALFKIEDENAQLHPLAQLSLIGKGMVESTIRNVLVSSGIGLSSGLIGLFTGDLGKVSADALGGLLFSTAFIGLTAGLVLYYVLPFLPFLYFFFALANWVKGIFEAMVGAPLWALAHIRIDGEGLPGDAASNGYLLILDILLRPIIIVFGLIASILVFGAQVKILNIIWDLVVQNSTGYDQHQSSVNIVGDLEMKRDIIDQFFFTVIYTIIVYMLANASFKLIDMIPKDLMRWMGSGVTSFGDMAQGPAGSLQQYVAMGGLVQGQQLAGAVNDLSKGLGGQLSGIFKSNTPQQGGG